MQAMGLVAVDNVSGWVHFDDVGQYLYRGGLVCPVDTAGFFDSVKKWGQNLGKKFKALGKKIQPIANKIFNNAIVNQAKTWIATIPGYGTAIAAGLGGLQGVAAGKGIKDVLLDAAQSAVPAGLGKTVFSAARSVVDSALKKGANAKSVIANAAKAGAQLGVDKLIQNPQLRGMATSALAQVSGLDEGEAQLAQAALMRALAPNAPAFPTGTSLDEGLALLAQTNTQFDDAARVLIEPPRALSLSAELTLMQLVPALRRADERLRRLVVKGSLVGGGSTSDAAGLEGNQYRVEVGDYGGRIVAKLGHPGEVRALIAANPGRNIDKLYPGDLLHLPPGWGPAVPPSSPANIPADAPLPGGAPNPTRLYEVVSGDYGAKIAAKFGRGPDAVPELVAANPQTNLDYLQPGDLIVIPDSWPPLAGSGSGAPVTPSPAPPIPPPPPYTVPLPEVVDPYEGTPTPTPGMPPPPFDTIPLPSEGSPLPGIPLPSEGSPLPGIPLPDAPWAPTAAHVARAQAILAAWAAKYPQSAIPQDFGRVQGDLSAVWTERSVMICKSYQAWANRRGAALRADGALDKPTFTSLENTLADLVGATPPPPAAGTSSGRRGGSALPFALAAALLF